MAAMAAMAAADSLKCDPQFGMVWIALSTNNDKNEATRS